MRLETDTQIIVIVATKHNVDPLFQRSESERDALPSFPAHEQRVHLRGGRVRRDLAKVCQILWDVPGHRAAPSNTILFCCGDDEGEWGHRSKSL